MTDSPERAVARSYIDKKAEERAVIDKIADLQTQCQKIGQELLRIEMSLRKFPTQAFIFDTAGQARVVLSIYQDLEGDKSVVVLSEGK